MNYDWTFEGEPFTTELAQEKIDSGHVGFVYLVTNLETGKKYIGKKLLTRKIKRPPLKGMKRKRISVVQSDWINYWTSNFEIMEAATTSPEIFSRQILEFALSKGELSYMELCEQISRQVLLRDDFYNGIVQCRISSSHLKNLKIRCTDL